MLRSFHEEVADPRETGRRLARRALSHGKPSEAVLVSSHPAAEEIGKEAREQLGGLTVVGGEGLEGALLLARFTPIPHDNELCSLFSVTPEELSVYKLLQESGPSTVSDLREESGLSPSKLYDTLSSLAEKKFASCEPFRPMKFTAKPLLQALNDRSEQLERKADEMKMARKYFLEKG